MQIWETTQGLGYLHVNNSYTTVSSSTPSLKATVNGALGAVLASRNGARDTGTGENRTLGMSTTMGDGVIAEQRDFIPLEANSNRNNRPGGRGGVGGGGQQLGSGVAVVWRGLTEVAGHPNKRKRENKASTFGFNSSLLHGGSGADTEGFAGYTGTPWKVRNYSEGIVG